MKDWKEIVEECQKIDFTDFGEAIFNAVNESDNYLRDIGSRTLFAIDRCKTEREFDLVNRMFTAITGWRIETIINRVMENEEREVE